MYPEFMTKEENEMYGGGICNYDIYFASTPEPEEEIEFVGNACYNDLSNGAWNLISETHAYDDICNYDDWCNLIL